MTTTPSVGKMGVDGRRFQKDAAICGFKISTTLDEKNHSEPN